MSLCISMISLRHSNRNNLYHHKNGGESQWSFIEFLMHELRIRTCQRVESNSSRVSKWIFLVWVFGRVFQITNGTNFILMFITTINIFREIIRIYSATFIHYTAYTHRNALFFFVVLEFCLFIFPNIAIHFNLDKLRWKKGFVEDSILQSHNGLSWEKQ